jgi:hypothetical protein
MRAYRLLLLVLIASQSSQWQAEAQQSRFRALAFYSKNAEGDHVQFAQDAINFLRNLAAHEHFTFDATSSWEDLDDEHLKNVQLVIWLNESPAKTEQRRAFERYIQHGGAWLGFHAAGYNDKDTNWPWFVDFMGGAVFYTNSWPPLPAQLTIDNRAHPVAAGVPSEFQSPSNEWYVWRPSPRLNSDVQILATFDPSNYPIGFKDVLSSGDLPVVWTNTKYRMIYVNMGHGRTGEASGDRKADQPARDRIQSPKRQVLRCEHSPRLRDRAQCEWALPVAHRGWERTRRYQCESGNESYICRELPQRNGERYRRQQGRGYRDHRRG